MLGGAYGSYLDGFHVGPGSIARAGTGSTVEPVIVSSIGAFCFGLIYR